MPSYAAKVARGSESGKFLRELCVLRVGDEVISGNCMGLRDRALSKIEIGGILKTARSSHDAINKKKKGENLGGSLGRTNADGDLQERGGGRAKWRDGDDTTWQRRGGWKPVLS